MEKTLKDFYEAALKTAFDGLNILKATDNNIFVLLFNADCKLTAADICDYLDKQYMVTYNQAYIKMVGAPCHLLDDSLKDAKSICPELDFNITDNFGDCTVEIVYGSTVAKQAFDSAFRAIVARVNNYVYALENISLAERLVQLLKLRRMRIGVAESFTGGGISKRLVEISGVSEVYFEGLNTYANEAKIQRLGVNEFTLKQYGAVSKEVAAQMAEGLLLTGNCNIGLSTTGIAGPKSDNTNKPVGLIYIGVATDEGTQVYEFNLKGSRREITETAINLALFAAFKKVK
ncbi:MAG: CinA family protein [Clostridia bacterium]|nr:CinA family protein [Clostridia bacterium]